MTHSLNVKAVNDAEYHIIKILFQKSKIKIILISCLSVVWGWVSFMMNLLKEKLYMPSLFLEVTEQVWQRFSGLHQCCVKIRIGLCCFVAEHLHILY